MSSKNRTHKGKGGRKVRAEFATAKLQQAVSQIQSDLHSKPKRKRTKKGKASSNSFTASATGSVYSSRIPSSNHFRTFHRISGTPQKNVDSNNMGAVRIHGGGFTDVYAYGYDGEIKPLALLGASTPVYYRLLSPLYFGGQLETLALCYGRYAFRELKITFVSGTGPFSAVAGYMLTFAISDDMLIQYRKPTPNFIDISDYPNVAIGRLYENLSSSFKFKGDKTYPTYVTGSGIDASDSYQASLVASYNAAFPALYAASSMGNFYAEYVIDFYEPGAPAAGVTASLDEWKDALSLSEFQDRQSRVFSRVRQPDPDNTPPPPSGPIAVTIVPEPEPPNDWEDTKHDVENTIASGQTAVASIRDLLSRSSISSPFGRPQSALSNPLISPKGSLGGRQ